MVSDSIVQRLYHGSCSGGVVFWCVFFAGGTLWFSTAASESVTNRYKILFQGGTYGEELFEGTLL